jgi:hypothetical protein
MGATANANSKRKPIRIFIENTSKWIYRHGPSPDCTVSRVVKKMLPAVGLRGRRFLWKGQSGQMTIVR